MGKSYPYAKTVDSRDDYFGTVVEDPYRWLEDAKNPEVLDFVSRENAYTSAWFEEAGAKYGMSINDFTEKQRKASDTFFYQGLTKCPDGYYAVMEHQGNYSFVKTGQAFQNTEVVLDRAILGGAMNIYEAVCSPVNPDLFAVFVLKDGAPRPSVLIYDVSADETLYCLDLCFSFCWSEDGKKLIYSDAILDRENSRNINRICLYDLDTRKTGIVYQYEQNAVYIEVTPGPDNGIFAQVLLTYGDELLVYIDAENTCTVLTRGKGVCSYIGETGGMCYFLTDMDAPFCRLIRVRETSLYTPLAVEEASETVIPERDALLNACAVAGGKLFAAYQKDAVSSLQYFDCDGRLLGEAELPDAYGNIYARRRMTARGNILYLQFESFLHPKSMLALDVETLELCTIYQEKEPEPVDEFEVRQQFITARDGTRILAYLVLPKKGMLPECMPALLYGYGGYAFSNEPSYQNMVTGINIPDWVRQGRMYVHCVIHGGSEYGAKWHEAGMLTNKKHVFEDFIDIARWLVDTGWTTAKQITATGLSNGGLLMTAISTMRPDLFGTVIASVPHTDMLRFCVDDRGPMYITEYGNPMDEEQFPYLYSYSPYHNIQKGTVYPAMYVQTGECDNNVPPYHGKKFAARLQKEASDQNPVLLRVLPEGSHDRGSGEYYYRTTAEMQMFIEINLKRQAFTT